MLLNCEVLVSFPSIRQLCSEGFLDTLEEATQLLTSDGGGGGDSSEVTIADIANYINSFPLSSLGKGSVMRQA